MDQIPAEIVDKPPLPPYPPPDFSVPPPPIKELPKLPTTTTTKVEKIGELRKETTRHHRSSSRDRDRSRISRHASSSRDYRSQSRHSTSSRFSSQRDLGRDSYKRKRSRTRSPYRKSSRRSPSNRSGRSPHRDRPSSSRRSLARRDSRDSRSTRESVKPSMPPTERERLLKKWRNNYCATSDQISKKLLEMSNDEEQASWIRASPADIHYRRTKDVVESTPRLDALCTLFDDELLKRAAKTRAKQAPYVTPNRRQKIRVCRHKSEFGAS